MITVDFTISLVWHKEPTRKVHLPSGLKVHEFLKTIGQEELTGHALIVINKKVSDLQDEIKDGDAIILLSVMSGG